MSWFNFEKPVKKQEATQEQPPVPAVEPESPGGVAIDMPEAVAFATEHPAEWNLLVSELAKMMGNALEKKMGARLVDSARVEEALKQILREEKIAAQVNSVVDAGEMKFGQSALRVSSELAVDVYHALNENGELVPLVLEKITKSTH